MQEEFIFNNPFERNSVGPDEIWAEGEEGFQDVASINQSAFKILTDDIKGVKVSRKHITKIRFIVGSSGSGKSHLFSRLRRQLEGQAIFVYASNPPTRSDDILAWTLKEVVLGMKHHCITAGVVKPYSQLHAALYATLQPLFGFQESLDEFHTFAQNNSEAFFNKAQSCFLKLLPNEPDIGRALVHVLHPERSDLAFRWLAGSTNLSEVDLKAIEQNEPLKEEAGLQLVCRLGKVTFVTKTPIVLVLDQLDLMTSSDLVDAFQRILFGLIDNSKNWYVAVSLLQDKFDLWQKYLSKALLGKLQSESSLPVIELRQISDPKEKRTLILQRLALPYLVQLREQSQKDPLYPLQKVDIDELIAGTPILPRDLINNASAKYIEQLKPGETPLSLALATEMRAEFDQALASIPGDNIAIQKAELADRLRELIEVVCAAQGRSFTAQTGPLESRPNFHGTDTLLKIGERQVRLLGHHIHQRAQFPNFLSKVMSLPPETVLVRDGSIPISGKATQEKLSQFQKDKIFIHLSKDGIRDAYALGQVLAKMRAGDFTSIKTDPLPTEENIKRYLGNIPRLAQGQVVQKIFQLLEPTPLLPPPSPLPPPPTTSVVKAVRSVMQSAHWLVFERLQRHLKSMHCLEISPEELRNAIASAPLRHELLCYPADIHAPVDMHILIWSEECHV
jgi:hypothetical protein